MIYLDNAASTPVHEKVIEEMVPYFREQYGNPSSIHRHGRFANMAIQNARKRIASLINAHSNEILVTSGGTESNNTAIYGIASQSKGKHIITSSIEHDAILEPCKRLEKEGYMISFLPVDRYGFVDPEDLKKEISSDTCLITIMYANNEVGTIQSIKEMVQIAREKNVIFHTDAVQAVGKIPVDVKELGVDLLSISSHKINGPKGVGALYIRNGVKISPLILGGGQENGLRSGTENVASIVGFGTACELAKNNMSENSIHLKKLTSKLTTRILQEIPATTLNGHPNMRTPNNTHFTFFGINGEDLIIKLDEHKISASTGSACSVKIQKASHVLKAMGFSHEQVTGSLRLTAGITNTEQEIDETVDTLKKVVQELRAVSPYKSKYNF
ncbi:cysteine desulfurase family protein [Candidatus Nitrosotalea okcheonensis]|uniref:cysteine desulfurase n=1 Tax=Candidatus Nitrosotalea okcheonensis TaxID=1903276 RepID=A0A2H1FIA3_9ARCH|nr:cysteine desulfurase family protein [Candidatus Nitrosotalea okcheonensis]SMH72454.1 Cysteine desulfurase [Candidatus Nitrosotalea okcheonensis]